MDYKFTYYKYPFSCQLFLCSHTSTNKVHSIGKCEPDFASCSLEYIQIRLVMCQIVVRYYGVYTPIRGRQAKKVTSS